MSRLAVKASLQRVLQDVTAPVELLVLTQPRKFVQVADRALATVFVPRSHESRLTLRGMAQSQKRLRYDVAVHLDWVWDDPDSGGSKFDELLDRVDLVLRNYQKTLPEVLTDPVSGIQSQLVYVSEEVDTQVEYPELDENEGSGFVKFSAVKTVRVEEWVSE